MLLRVKAFVFALYLFVGVLFLVKYTRNNVTINEGEITCKHIQKKTQINFGDNHVLSSVVTLQLNTMNALHLSSSSAPLHM